LGVFEQPYQLWPCPSSPIFGRLDLPLSDIALIVPASLAQHCSTATIISPIEDPVCVRRHPVGNSWLACECNSMTQVFEVYIVSLPVSDHRLGAPQTSRQACLKGPPSSSLYHSPPIQRGLFLLPRHWDAGPFSLASWLRACIHLFFIVLRKPSLVTVPNLSDTLLLCRPLNGPFDEHSQTSLRGESPLMSFAYLSVSRSILRDMFSLPWTTRGILVSPLMSTCFFSDFLSFIATTILRQSQALRLDFSHFPLGGVRSSTFPGSFH